MKFNKKEQSSNTYDEMFKQGGYQGVYNLPYRYSPYYPMYNAVLGFLIKYNVKSILEVGCGSGAFSNMVFDSSSIEYQGFDFSSVAIEKSRQFANDSFNSFWVGDATKLESYPENYEAIVCTEVLEHIPHDLLCIENWKKGVFCVCSVPNYDSVYHERFFRSVDDVVQRYGELIDIYEVIKIKKPVLTDLRLSSYVNFIRWNRYKPCRLLDLLGFSSFDNVGGWFVFVGFKK
jgi:SAM-dependent methyltransferase